jgi:hypothetical protein
MARHFGRRQPITQPLPPDTYDHLPETPPWYPHHDDPHDVEEGGDDDVIVRRADFDALRDAVAEGRYVIYPARSLIRNARMHHDTGGGDG